MFAESAAWTATAARRIRYRSRTHACVVRTALLLVTAAASSVHAQVSERGSTFRDWVVGCDNGLTCKAIGLSDGQGEVSVERAADANAPPTVTFAPARGVTAIGDVTISVDGRRVTAITKEVEPSLREGRANADRLISALASGVALEIRVDDQIVARPSLLGATAALRYMDQRQGRAGTSTALVARGGRGANTMRRPPQLPTIRAMAPMPGLRAEPLASDERERARETAACDNGGPRDLGIHAISVDAGLVLVPCEGEPYNIPFRALIAAGAAGARTFTLASFDIPPPPGIDGGRALLYNPVWNAEEGVLSNDYKLRSAGDCGSSASYAWDGARFRRISSSSMWECRGSSERITLWRGIVVRK